MVRLAGIARMRLRQELRLGLIIRPQVARHSPWVRVTGPRSSPCRARIRVERRGNVKWPVQVRVDSDLYLVELFSVCDVTKPKPIAQFICTGLGRRSYPEDAVITGLRQKVAAPTV